MSRVSPDNFTLAGDLGSRLADLRGALGIGQAEFGALFGRTWKQVSAWENGRQAPRPSVIIRAAERHEWPLEMFAEGGPMPSALVASHASRGGSDEMSEAEEQFRSFVRGVKRTVRALAGNPDLFSAEETRLNRLAVIRAVVASAVESGRPVPDFVEIVEAEVRSDAFR